MRVSRAALALWAIGVAACTAASWTPPFPETVWVPRSRAARLDELGNLDTRLAPGGERVELSYSEETQNAAAGETGMVCAGGNCWTRPTAAEVARDPALSAEEDALLEFSVAARSAESVPMVTGARTSEPQEIRYALSGRTERVGGTTWWEFRRLPIPE